MTEQAIKFLIDLTFGNIASLIAVIGGAFMTGLMNIIVSVAQFNGFTNNEAIVDAWVLIRDICNMFFVLILLVIAFATILQLENYSMKRWLPKLILMAVLVNFSRMIVGLLIDASQIIMLTFVNAFSVSKGGEWWEFFGVTSFLSALKFNSDVTLSTATGNLAAYYIGGIFVIITCLALLGVLMVFVMRLVMLWILVVLSPLGFFLLAFPGGQKYASQYWGELKTYLMNGPVLAFFIWLALTTINSINIASGFNIDVNNFNPSTGSAALDPENLIRFVLALSFILVGLKISTQIGGYGSSWGAGAVRRFANRGVTSAKRSGIWTGKKALQGTQAVAREGWAQSQKLKTMRGAKGLAQKFKSAGGAGTGAVIGTAIAPGIGTAIGAGVGAMMGKYTVDKFSEKRKRNQRRYQASQKEDKGQTFEKDGQTHWYDNEAGQYFHYKDGTRTISRDNDDNVISRWGEYSDSKGNKYRRNEEGEMKRVNSKGEFVKTDNNGNEEITDFKGADKANTKAMTDGQAERWAGYSTVKYKGWGAKDAVVDEQVGKLASEYQTQSKETLQHFLDLEKDETKQMAVSLALAMKKGFADGVKGIKQVVKAKDFLSGNSLLQKRVSDEMNKRHMILNNSRIEKRADGTEKVVLDDGQIAKLISSGATKWRDQNWKTHNEESIKLMSKQLGTDFAKEYSSSLKTNKDKDTATKTIGKFVKDLNFDDRDNSIRKAFASTSGDFVKAFQDASGVNQNELGKMISKISKASDFADVNESSRNNPVFREQFANNINISMLNKMNNSPDIDSALMKEYAHIVKDHNRGNLFNQMKSDSKLKSLAEDVS